MVKHRKGVSAETTKGVLKLIEVVAKDELLAAWLSAPSTRKTKNTDTPRGANPNPKAVSNLGGRGGYY